MAGLNGLLIPIVVGCAFAIFRKYLPAKVQAGQFQLPPDAPRLPTGLFTCLTLATGAVIGTALFFGMRVSNHLWAQTDGPAPLTIYPTPVTWYFLAFLAAIAAPWPLAIAILRHTRCREEAAYVEARTSAEAGFDCFRVLVGMNIFLVLPIAVATLLAVPMHLTLKSDTVLWTPYASLLHRRYAYIDARAAYVVEGYRLRNNRFRPHQDLLIDFSDGRRLDANAVGDGGTVPSGKEMQFLLEHTRLIPRVVRWEEDIPSK